MANRLWTNFTFRYVLGLSGVAVLAIAGQAYVQWALHRQEIETRVVDIALQQRFLSHGLGGLVSAIQLAAGPEERRDQLKEFGDVLVQLDHNQQKLIDEMGYWTPWSNLDELSGPIARVKEDFQAIRTQGWLLISEFQNVNHENRKTLGLRTLSYIQTIMAHQADFTDATYQMSSRLQEGARVRFHRLQSVELGVLVLILLVLVFEAVLVFRPVVEKIEKAILEFEESEERLSAILESTPDPFITVNLGGEIIDFNPAAEATFGTSRELVVGKLLQTLIIPERFRNDFEKDFSRYLDRRINKLVNTRIEIVGVRSDGSEFPMEISITPTSSVRDPFFAIYLRDISFRKQTEGELLKAKEAAEGAVQIRSEFISRMSHEIRNPMNTILGMSDLLSESVTDVDQKKYIQIQNRAGRVLLSFINDILDFSKLEAGSLELLKVGFDPGLAVENVVDLVASQAQEKNLEIVISLDPTLPTQVQGDRKRLQQVLLNLFQNAIKFTDNGSICVSIQVNHSQKELIFSVVDTGIGIQKELQDRVFESFVQVDSSLTRKSGGAGLGLNISRQLVELMGGHIWVESVFGKGSTFSFSFRSHPEDVWNERKKNEKWEVKRILLGTSSEIVLKALELSLVSLGCQVDVARNLDEITRHLERSSRYDGLFYDFLLLDEKMDNSSGVEFLKSMKTKLIHKQTRIILMIPIVGAHLIIHQSHDLGVECLFKPVKPSELKEFLSMSSSNQILPRVPNVILDESEVPKMNILVVDDSQDNHLVVRSFLKKTPVSIDDAFNGEEALKKVRQGDYQLVLLDIQMPVMDGYAAARLMREYERTHFKRPVAIVALTAFDGEVELQRCLEAGCSDHLTKPISKKAFIARIIKLSQSSRRREYPNFEIDDSLRKLLPKYLSNRQNDLSKIQGSLVNREYSVIANIGHQLKGNARTYGMPELEEIGKQLEIAGNAGDKDLIEKLYGEMAGYLNHLNS